MVPPPSLPRVPRRRGLTHAVVSLAAILGAALTFLSYIGAFS